MNSIAFTDCTKLNAREREELFGKGFADVNVVGYGQADGVCFTKVVLEGHNVILVGEPEQALHAYLLGGGKENVKGSA